MADLDEEQGWIRRSQQGDHEAFASLVKRHQRMIHAVTYRMTGSEHDSEDLAQETFIHAFRQMGNYRAEARFSSWLYRIAVNLCLNWKGRQERQQHLQTEWAENRAAGGLADEGRAQSVQDALMKLKPKQRAALVLTVYEGLNHAEAAHALGCAEATVSWRVFAARNKLKSLLKDIPRGTMAHAK
jgi:RNA polymerase sigma-70 factor (ECF subfamily)